jgi:cytochrome P450
MLTKLLPIDNAVGRPHTGAMDDPLHALAAPSHPDPYGWYARLRVGRPLFFDAALGLWVVSAPYLVEQALLHPALRVRPAAQPVPEALRGTATGEVFALLVRMNDGDFHAAHRPEVAQGAARLGAAAVAGASEAATRHLAPRTDANALLSAIPVQAMARLLGVADADLDRTVDWVHDFTRGIAPGADAQALARADRAARGLMAQGEREGLSRVRAANRIAFMQQALDGTAGLIGNAIRRVQLLAKPEADPTALVADTAHRDPSIHNTRRFAAADLALGGHSIARGDGLLLLLVGETQRPLAFGAGAHVCPGERIALQIAASALQSLQELDALARFGSLAGYRPLPNARIPVFGAPA